MLPFTSIIPLILVKIGEIFFDPLFWLVVLLVGLMYRRTFQLKENFFGLTGDSVWREVVAATIFGVIGGVLGSFLLVLAGVSLTNIGISYLWPVAVLLMLINPRFLCFSYAGGLISLSYLVLGWPIVDVPQLMGLVAILHMVESVLIRFSGHLGAVPVYMQSGNGQVAGAFNLQKFWPLPLVGLVIVSQAPEASQVISVPQWWPLIKPNLSRLAPDASYVFIPILAALGYSDLAMASTPAQKSKKSGFELGIYSIILLGLAIAASHYRWLAWLPALFGPLAHEYLIRRGQKAELSGRPIYVAAPNGVKILSVERVSPAAELGLKSGDIIISVNGQKVFNRFELAAILENSSGHLNFEVKRGSRLEQVKGYKPLGKPFGIIPVPEVAEEHYVEMSSQGILKRLINKFKS